MPSSSKGLLPMVLAALGLSSPAVADTSVMNRTDGGSALFEMLGMAGEYLSRFDPASGEPHPELVEHFYPHEAALANRYEQLIREYQGERQVRFAYRRTTEGGHIYLRSRVLSQILNSNYVVRDGLASLDPGVLARATPAEQMRYLIGFYRRFGEGASNAACMANTHKPLLAAEVLERLGALQVEVYRSQDTIPTGFCVLFQPGGQLNDGRLPITRWVADFADHQRHTWVRLR